MPTNPEETREMSKKYRFVPDETGEHTKEEFTNTTLHEILEDGIIDLQSAKGQSQWDKIMTEIEQALRIALGPDNEDDLALCKEFLANPEDVFVMDKVQKSTTNQDLRHFLCLHGYELGIQALQGN